MNLKFLVAAILASASAMAQAATNPFKPPASPATARQSPSPAAPQGLPTPGHFNPGNPNVPPPPPVMAHQGPTGLPDAPAPVPEETVEEFHAVRVGTVNGKTVYRGEHGGYLFEAPKKGSEARRVVKVSAMRPAVGASQPAATQSRPDLPSMVGKPAPR